MTGRKQEGCVSARLLVSLVLIFATQQFSVGQGAPPQASSGAAKTAPSPQAPKLVKFHEDRTTLTIDTSVLPTETPVLGQKDDGPKATFVREFWQVSWRPADPIDLYVILPKGVAKPPVILYLYSFPADVNNFGNDQWCADATSGGYAAVGFVSALTGYRLEHRPGQWFVSQLQEALAASTHDVQMVLNFLAARNEFDMDHIGMYGEGSGGAIAILASAADSRIKALEALDPWGDWPDWLAKSASVPNEERPNYLKPDFLAAVAPLDPATWLPKVKAQYVRIDTVQTDPRLPEIVRKKIEAAAPDKAEIDQFGDGHAFVMSMRAAGRSFAWLKDQLQPGASPVILADKSQRTHYYPPAISDGLPQAPGNGAGSTPNKP